MVTIPFFTSNSIESRFSILEDSSSERSAARFAFNCRFASSHLYPKGVFTRNFDPVDLLLPPEDERGALWLLLDDSEDGTLREEEFEAFLLFTEELED